MLNLRPRQVTCFKLVTIALFASGLIPVHAQVVASANRPAKVPEGYLVTPMGYFHPSCVKQVAKGDVLHPDEKAIYHADGSFDSMQTCAYPHFTAKGELVPMEPTSNDTGTAKRTLTPLNPSADSKNEKPPFIGHSWMVDVEAFSTSSYGEVTSEFKCRKRPLPMTARPSISSPACRTSTASRPRRFFSLCWVGMPTTTTRGALPAGIAA